MKQSVVRHSPADNAARSDGEPAIVAFRSLRDQPSPEPDDPQTGELPVLLRLPDLNQAADAPATSESAGGNPLVGKAMWVGTGLLALVAVGLIVTGKQPEQPRRRDAPRWNENSNKPKADAKPTNAHSQSQAQTRAAPAVGSTPANGSPDRPLWRSDAKVIQPQAPAEFEAPLAAEERAPNSASWPGDHPPMTTEPYGRPTEQSDPSVNATRPYAAPGSYPVNVAPPSAPTGPVAPQQTIDSYPADPWPGAPAWPSSTQRGGPGVRTAARPETGARPPANASGEARLEGGIRTMEMSPNYDRARPSLH